MAYRLELHFEGLCVYLPSQPIVPGRILDWVSVLMVNTDQLGTPLRRHFCRVEFDLQDRSGENPLLVPDDARVTWTINQEDVFLSFGSPRRRGIEVAAGLAPQRAEKPVDNSPQVEDFRWVPSLRNVLPPDETYRRFGRRFNAGDVDRSCLLPLPGDRIVARVHLSRGRLSVYDPIRVHDEICVCQFIPSDVAAPFRQAVAAKSVLVIRGVTQSIKIRARDFNGVWREISFGDAGHTEAIKIYFKNLCSDIPGGYEETSRDHDFEWHYRLTMPSDLLGAKGLPSPAPVRYQIPDDVGDYGDGGGEFRKCASARANALSGKRKRLYEDMLEAINPGWRQVAPLVYEDTSSLETGSEANSSQLVEGATLPRLFRSLRTLSLGEPSAIVERVTQRNPLEDFNLEQQKGKLWCWAAAASGVARHYEGDAAPGQCAVAKLVKGTDCCEDDEVLGFCDNTESVREALEKVKHLAQKAPSRTFLDDITQEYDAKRPLVCRMKDWVPATDPNHKFAVHVLIVRGTVKDGNRLLVRTIDPWDRQHGRYLLSDFEQQLFESPIFTA